MPRNHKRAKARNHPASVARNYVTDLPYTLPMATPVLIEMSVEDRAQLLTLLETLSYDRRVRARDRQQLSVFLDKLTEPAFARVTDGSLNYVGV